MRIAVLGVGLIGGSIGLAARERLGADVAGFDPEPANLLRALDVGLMPLPDDEWSRGKCGMKALQYMAFGIPPVVSPVGVNATAVRVVAIARVRVAGGDRSSQAAVLGERQHLGTASERHVGRSVS